MSISTVTSPLLAIAPGSANLVFSPYNWRFVNGLAISNTPGAYLTCVFSGSSLTLTVDNSSLVAAAVPASSYPKIRWSIDNSVWHTVTLNSASSSVGLASGLSGGEHQLNLYFLGIDYTLNRWTNETGFLKIVNLVPSSTSISTPIVKSKKLLIYGDSITEGLAINDGSFDRSSVRSYAALVGEGFNAEYGQIGFGSQGWTVAGAGSVPKFTDAWDKYYGTNSRLIGGLLSPVPDCLIVVHGTNDSLANPVATDAAVTSAVSSWLVAARAAAGINCEIFVVAPFGLFKKDAIALGVSNYQASSNDSKTNYLDCGVYASTGITSIALGLNAFSSDGIHPNVFNSSRLAAIVTQSIGRVIASKAPKLVSGVGVEPR